MHNGSGFGNALELSLRVLATFLWLGTDVNLVKSQLIPRRDSIGLIRTLTKMLNAPELLQASVKQRLKWLLRRAWRGVVIWTLKADGDLVFWECDYLFRCRRWDGRVGPAEVVEL